jgi:hypothetical protein
MAADNVLALFLLPFFGALSDKTSTRIGRRMFSFTAMLLLDGAVSPRNRNIVASFGRFVYNYAAIVFYFARI